ncbi:MAG: hypothetical protein KKG21_00160 [Candidatus Omnitrophica bacterium]|nr:hypothetical protein [Candidatus Omnitrophota bacterium]
MSIRGVQDKIPSLVRAAAKKIRKQAGKEELPALVKALAEAKSSIAKRTIKETLDRIEAEIGAGEMESELAEMLSNYLLSEDGRLPEETIIALSKRGQLEEGLKEALERADSEALKKLIVVATISKRIFGDDREKLRKVLKNRLINMGLSAIKIILEATGEGMLPTEELEKAGWLGEILFKDIIPALVEADRKAEVEEELTNLISDEEQSIPTIVEAYKALARADMMNEKAKKTLKDRFFSATRPWLFQAAVQEVEHQVAGVEVLAEAIAGSIDEMPNEGIEEILSLMKQLWHVGRIIEIRVDLIIELIKLLKPESAAPEDLQQREQMVKEEQILAKAVNSLKPLMEQIAERLRNRGTKALSVISEDLKQDPQDDGGWRIWILKGIFEDKGERTRQRIRKCLTKLLFTFQPGPRTGAVDKLIGTLVDIGAIGMVKKLIPEVGIKELVNLYRLTYRDKQGIPKDLIKDTDLERVIGSLNEEAKKLILKKKEEVELTLIDLLGKAQTPEEKAELVRLIPETQETNQAIAEAFFSKDNPEILQGAANTLAKQGALSRVIQAIIDSIPKGEKGIDKSIALIKQIARATRDPVVSQETDRIEPLIRNLAQDLEELASTTNKVIARLVKNLRQDPEDDEGWRVGILTNILKEMDSSKAQKILKTLLGQIEAPFLRLQLAKALFELGEISAANLCHLVGVQTVEALEFLIRKTGVDGLMKLIEEAQGQGEQELLTLFKQLARNWETIKENLKPADQRRLEERFTQAQNSFTGMNGFRFVCEDLRADPEDDAGLRTGILRRIVGELKSEEEIQEAQRLLVNLMIALGNVRRNAEILIGLVKVLGEFGENLADISQEMLMVLMFSDHKELVEEVVRLLYGKEELREEVFEAVVEGEGSGVEKIKEAIEEAKAKVEEAVEETVVTTFIFKKRVAVGGDEDEPDTVPAMPMDGLTEEQRIHQLWLDELEKQGVAVPRPPLEIDTEPEEYMDGVKNRQALSEKIDKLGERPLIEKVAELHEEFMATAGEDWLDIVYAGIRTELADALGRAIHAGLGPTSLKEVFEFAHAYRRKWPGVIEIVVKKIIQDQGLIRMIVADKGLLQGALLIGGWNRALRIAIANEMVSTGNVNPTCFIDVISELPVSDMTNLLIEAAKVRGDMRPFVKAIQQSRLVDDGGLIEKIMQALEGTNGMEPRVSLRNRIGQIASSMAMAGYLRIKAVDGGWEAQVAEERINTLSDSPALALAYGIADAGSSTIMHAGKKAANSIDVTTDVVRAIANGVTDSPSSGDRAAQLAKLILLGTGAVGAVALGPLGLAAALAIASMAWLIHGATNDREVDRAIEGLAQQTAEEELEARAKALLQEAMKDLALGKEFAQKAHYSLMMMYRELQGPFQKNRDEFYEEIGLMHEASEGTLREVRKHVENIEDKASANEALMTRVQEWSRNVDSQAGALEQQFTEEFDKIKALFEQLQTLKSRAQEHHRGIIAILNTARGSTNAGLFLTAQTACSHIANIVDEAMTLQSGINKGILKLERIAAKIKHLKDSVRQEALGFSAQGEENAQSAEIGQRRAIDAAQRGRVDMWGRLAAAEEKLALVEKSVEFICEYANDSITASEAATNQFRSAIEKAKEAERLTSQVATAQASQDIITQASQAIEDMYEVRDEALEGKAKAKSELDEAIKTLALAKSWAPQVGREVDELLDRGQQAVNKAQMAYNDVETTAAQTVSRIDKLYFRVEAGVSQAYQWQSQAEGIVAGLETLRDEAKTLTKEVKQQIEQNIKTQIKSMTERIKAHNKLRISNLLAKPIHFTVRAIYRIGQGIRRGISALGRFIGTGIAGLIYLGGKIWSAVGLMIKLVASALKARMAEDKTPAPTFEERYGASQAEVSSAAARMAEIGDRLKQLRGTIINYASVGLESIQAIVSTHTSVRKVVGGRGDLERIIEQVRPDRALGLGQQPIALLPPPSKNWVNLRELLAEAQANLFSPDIGEVVDGLKDAVQESQALDSSKVGHAIIEAARQRIGMGTGESEIIEVNIDAGMWPKLEKRLYQPLQDWIRERTGSEIVGQLIAQVLAPTLIESGLFVNGASLLLSWAFGIPLAIAPPFFALLGLLQFAWHLLHLPGAKGETLLQKLIFAFSPAKLSITGLTIGFYFLQPIEFSILNLLLIVLIPHLMVNFARKILNASSNVINIKTVAARASARIRRTLGFALSAVLSISLVASIVSSILPEIFWTSERVSLFYNYLRQQQSIRIMAEETIHALEEGNRVQVAYLKIQNFREIFNQLGEDNELGHWLGDIALEVMQQELQIHMAKFLEEQGLTGLVTLRGPEIFLYFTGEALLDEEVVLGWLEELIYESNFCLTVMQRVIDMLEEEKSVRPEKGESYDRVRQAIIKKAKNLCAERDIPASEDSNLGIYLNIYGGVSRIGSLERRAEDKAIIEGKREEEGRRRTPRTAKEAAEGLFYEAMAVSKVAQEALAIRGFREDEKTIFRWVNRFDELRPHEKQELTEKMKGFEIDMKTAAGRCIFKYSDAHEAYLFARAKLSSRGELFSFMKVDIGKLHQEGEDTILSSIENFRRAVTSGTKVEIKDAESRVFSCAISPWLSKPEVKYVIYAHNDLFKALVNQLAKSIAEGKDVDYIDATVIVGGDEFARLIWDPVIDRLRILRYDLRQLGGTSRQWGPTIGDAYKIIASKIIATTLPEHTPDRMMAYFENSEEEVVIKLDPKFNWETIKAGLEKGWLIEETGEDEYSVTGRFPDVTIEVLGEDGDMVKVVARPAVSIGEVQLSKEDIRALIGEGRDISTLQAEADTISGFLKIEAKKWQAEHPTIEDWKLLRPHERREMCYGALEFSDEKTGIVPLLEEEKDIDRILAKWADWIIDSQSGRRSKSSQTRDWKFDEPLAGGMAQNNASLVSKGLVAIGFAGYIIKFLNSLPLVKPLIKGDDGNSLFFTLGISRLKNLGLVVFVLLSMGLSACGEIITTPGLGQIPTSPPPSTATAVYEKSYIVEAKIVPSATVEQLMDQLIGAEDAVLIVINYDEEKAKYIFNFYDAAGLPVTYVSELTTDEKRSYPEHVRVRVEGVGEGFIRRDKVIVPRIIDKSPVELAQELNRLAEENIEQNRWPIYIFPEIRIIINSIPDNFPLDEYLEPPAKKAVVHFLRFITPAALYYDKYDKESEGVVCVDIVAVFVQRYGKKAITFKNVDYRIPEKAPRKLQFDLYLVGLYRQDMLPHAVVVVDLEGDMGDFENWYFLDTPYFPAHSEVVIYDRVTLEVDEVTSEFPVTIIANHDVLQDFIVGPDDETSLLQLDEDSHSAASWINIAASFQTVPEIEQDHRALAEYLIENDVPFILLGDSLIGFKEFSGMVLKKNAPRDLDETAIDQRLTGAGLTNLLEGFFASNIVPTIEGGLPDFISGVVYFYAGLWIPEGLSGFERGLLVRGAVESVFMSLHSECPNAGFGKMAGEWRESQQENKEQYGAILLEKLSNPEKRGEFIDAIRAQAGISESEVDKTIEVVDSAVSGEGLEECEAKVYGTRKEVLRGREILTRAMIESEIWNHNSSLYDILESIFGLESETTKFDLADIEIRWLEKEEYEGIESDLAERHERIILEKSRAMIEAAEDSDGNWTVRILFNAGYDSMAGIFHRTLKELVHAMILNVQGEIPADYYRNWIFTEFIVGYLLAGGILERLETDPDYAIKPELIELMKRAATEPIEVLGLDKEAYYQSLRENNSIAQLAERERPKAQLVERDGLVYLEYPDTRIEVANLDEGGKIFGKSIRAWAREHGLLMKKSIYWAEHEFKDERAFIELMYNLPVAQVRNRIEKYILAMGLELPAAWSSKMRSMRRRDSGGEPTALENLIKWYVEEQFRKLFGVIKIEDMSFLDLPIWPVTASGEINADLIGWMDAPKAQAPAEYFKAEKASSREIIQDALRLDLKLDDVAIEFALPLGYTNDGAVMRPGVSDGVEAVLRGQWDTGRLYSFRAAQEAVERARIEEQAAREAMLEEARLARSIQSYLGEGLNDKDALFLAERFWEFLRMLSKQDRDYLRKREMATLVLMLIAAVLGESTKPMFYAYEDPERTNEFLKQNREALAFLGLSVVVDKRSKTGTMTALVYNHDWVELKLKEYAEELLQYGCGSLKYAVSQAKKGECSESVMQRALFEEASRYIDNITDMETHIPLGLLLGYFLTDVLCFAGMESVPDDPDFITAHLSVLEIVAYTQEFGQLVQQWDQLTGIAYKLMSAYDQMVDGLPTDDSDVRGLASNANPWHREKVEQPVEDKLSITGLSAQIGRGVREVLPLYFKHWVDYIERSHKGILAAAERAENKGVAVVLGAGPCMDIPLSELVQTFEKVVLLDLDEESMEAAKEGLRLGLTRRDLAPEEIESLLSRIEIRKLDISLIVARLLDEVDKIIASSKGLDEARERLMGLFEEVKPEGQLPFMDEEVDLIVSSMFISQMFYYFNESMEIKLRDKFGAAGLSGGEDIQWLVSSSLFNLDKILFPHMRELERMLSPGGAIYLSSDVAVISCYDTPEGETVIKGSSNTLPLFHLSELVDDNLIIEDTSTWRWNCKPHSELGKMFDVEALILTRNSAVAAMSDSQHFQSYSLISQRLAERAEGGDKVKAIGIFRPAIKEIGREVHNLRQEGRLDKAGEFSKVLAGIYEVMRKYELFTTEAVEEKKVFPVAPAVELGVSDIQKIKEEIEGRGVKAGDRVLVISSLSRGSIARLKLCYELIIGLEARPVFIIGESDAIDELMPKEENYDALLDLRKVFTSDDTLNCFSEIMEIDEELKHAAKEGESNFLGAEKDDIVMITTDFENSEVFHIAIGLYDAVKAKESKPFIVMQPVKYKTGELMEDPLRGIFERIALRDRKSDPVFYVHLNRYAGEAPNRKMVSDADYPDIVKQCLVTNRLYEVGAAGIGMETFLQIGEVDYERVRRWSKALVERSKRGIRAVEVIDSEGKTLTIDILGQPFIDDIDVTESVDNGINLYGSEVCVSPVKGSHLTNGELTINHVIDVMGGWSILVDEPIRLTVKEGFVTEIKGGVAAEILKDSIIESQEKTRELAYRLVIEGKITQEVAEEWIRNVLHIGEFAIGLNPDAKILINLLSDEKIAGTIHIALGCNFSQDDNYAYALTHYDLIAEGVKVVFHYMDGEHETILEQGQIVMKVESEEPVQSKRQTAVSVEALQSPMLPGETAEPLDKRVISILTFLLLPIISTLALLHIEGTVFPALAANIADAQSHAFSPEATQNFLEKITLFIKSRPELALLALGACALFMWRWWRIRNVDSQVSALLPEGCLSQLVTFLKSRYRLEDEGVDHAHLQAKVAEDMENFSRYQAALRTAN